MQHFRNYDHFSKNFFFAHTLPCGMMNGPIQEEGTRQETHMHALVEV